MLGGDYSGTMDVGWWWNGDFEVKAGHAQSKERAPSKLMEMERERESTWVSRRIERSYRRLDGVMRPRLDGSTARRLNDSTTQRLNGRSAHASRFEQKGRGQVEGGLVILITLWLGGWFRRVLLCQHPYIVFD